MGSTMVDFVTACPHKKLNSKHLTSALVYIGGLVAHNETGNGIHLGVLGLGHPC
jgi:hypothetical protein